MEQNICIQLPLDCIECFIVDFHARRIDMPMSLNGTEYMYMSTTRVHTIFYRH
jgi:hypothetical protein